MPTDQITNPLAEETETASSGALVLTCVNNTTTTLKLGQIVSLTAYTTGGKARFVKKTGTTPGFNILGIVVGGKAAGKNTIPKNTIVLVLVDGIGQALFGASTTATHLVIGSTATAGLAKTATTATLAKTIGTVLQTKTISSGTALVWCYIHKM